MILTVITQSRVKITIKPGAYEMAVRGCIQRAIAADAGTYDQAALDTNAPYLALTNTSTVKPSTRFPRISQDRARLMAGQLEQMFPGEFLLADTEAVSPSVAAQN